MKYDVTVKTIPERYVASVRQVIPNYDQEGSLWSIFMKETAHLRIQDGDPCLCVALFHDGDYKESDVDVEIQKSVKGVYPDTEHVKFKTMPAVQVASAVCKGSYDQMGDVNAAVASWVEANGYTFDGTAFNIYHVSPHETGNPDDFVTEGCYPVRKKWRVGWDHVLFISLIISRKGTKTRQDASLLKNIRREHFAAAR